MKIRGSEADVTIWVEGKPIGKVADIGTLDIYALDRCTAFEGYTSSNVATAMGFAGRCADLTTDMERDVINDIGVEHWVALWYSVIRKLPAARKCDAAIAVVDEVHAFAGADGRYHPGDHRIEIQSQPTRPTVMLATIVHEVAHTASNPRHNRDHGYSWRRTFAQLVYEIVGAIDLERQAETWRRKHGHRWNPRPSRAAVLDILGEQVLVHASMTFSKSDRSEVEISTPMFMEFRRV